MVSIDYTVDWAQRAIDLARSGAPDHEIVKALANREKKIKALNMSEDQAGSTKALKDYLSIISGSSSNKSKSEQTIVKPDEKGVVEVDPGYKFDPDDFWPSTNTSNSNVATSSSGINKIIGYVIIGLIGIAILDKIVG